MHKYGVVSRGYYIRPQGWGELEPPEYATDYVEVEAPTKRAARVLAVREWRKLGHSILHDSDQNPFGLIGVVDDLCHIPEATEEAQS